jgi:transcriptional regulator of acetoin/glycerol metabolism
MTEALVITGWVQLRAARLIKMPRRTFVTKMKLYGIRRS